MTQLAMLDGVLLVFAYDTKTRKYYHIVYIHVYVHKYGKFSLWKYLVSDCNKIVNGYSMHPDTNVKHKSFFLQSCII